LASEALGGPAKTAALPEAFSALMRACKIPVELPSECAGVEASALAVEMKNDANVGMAHNAACPINDKDLDELAVRMMRLRATDPVG
ncbi:MAG: hypothetical protein AAFY31_18215, partial [Pseudomonadota bacterium]